MIAGIIAIIGGLMLYSKGIISFKLFWMTIVIITAGMCASER